MSRPMLQYFLAVTVVALLAACSSEDSANIDTTVARLEVSPSSALLTGNGQTAQLSVTAYNAAGSIVDATGLELASSAAAIAVDSHGLLTSTQAVGSALITAKVGDVVSKPVFVAAVTTVPNARLLADNEIATTPTPVDPTDHYRVGALYSVGLTTSTLPNVGDIIISSGEKSVGGRVVALDGGSVTYAIVALPELFSAVSVEVSYDPATVASLLVLADNSDALTSVECESEGQLISLAAGVELNIDPSLQLNVTYDYHDGVLDDFYITAEGALVSESHVSLGFGAGFAGEFECKLDVASLPIPITGPLAPILAPLVPFSVVAKAETQIMAAGVTLSLDHEFEGSVEMGLIYSASAGLHAVHDFSFVRNELTPSLNWGADNSLRVKTTLFAGLETGISVGNLLAKLDTVTLDVGPEFEAKFGGTFDVARDAAYDAGYALKLSAAIGPGDELDDFLHTLSIGDPVSIALKKEVEFASSPGAKDAKVDAGSFAVGDPMTFHVEVDDGSGALPAFGYNIHEVRVYSLDDASSTATLIGSQAATDGATTFDIPWTASFAGNVSSGGTPKFYAFVVDKLFGVVTQSFPLELDAFQGIGLEIRPQSQQLAPGETFKFTAYRENEPIGAGYVWTATGGTIDGDGNYTAGDAVGSYEVTVYRNDGSAEYATASVVISAMKLEPEIANVAPHGTKQFVATYAGGPLDNATWTATGGTIDASGLFTAGSENGAFEVRVTSTDHPNESAKAVVNVGSLCSKTGSETYCIFPLPYIDGTATERYCGNMINDAGQVAGGYTVVSGDTVGSSAFLYADGAVTLYDNPLGVAGVGAAHVLSESGVIAGVIADTAGGTDQVYVFNGSSPGFQAAPTFPYTSIQLSGTNGVGDMMIGVVSESSGARTTAVWSNGGLTLLDMKGGTANPKPVMNASGEAGFSVYNYDSNSGSRLLRRATDGTVTLMPLVGTNYSIPVQVSEGLSDSGLLLGAQTFGINQNAYQYAVVWTGATGQLQSWTQGYLRSYGYDINDSGTVVGSVSDANASYPAVMVSGVMTRLSDLLPVNNGWTFTRLWAINNLGQIAACGYSPSGFGGAILQPVD